MPERAAALLALWNDVDPALAQDYETWHAFEHVPERCTVPGILWGWRFGRPAQGPQAAQTDANTMPQYLTLYGLRDTQVLDSASYQRLLHEPTPMSRRMRPALRQVSRWVCDVHVNTLDDGVSRLFVWTALDPEGGMADLGGPSTAPQGRLWAMRRDDAAPLPWLRRGADAGAGLGADLGVSGTWLACSVQEPALRDPPRRTKPILYRRLQGGMPTAPPGDR